MNDGDWLSKRFEERRPHLRGVAYRMLGSLAEAEEAVQDAWLRVERADATSVENLDGWLTTIVARVCLNILRTRRARPEEPSGVHVPDPVLAREGGDPEREALLADSIGLALLVVLDTLEPAERLAFVLHDMFDLPFDEIGPLVGRSATAARQLASRARRRVRGAAVPEPNHDVARQRAIVDAFFAAARGGDFGALVALLDPNVVLRADGGPKRPQASAVVRGAENVARHAIRFANPAAVLRPARVNGSAGVIAMIGDQPFSVMGFTMVGDRIVEIHAVVDPERLARLDLNLLGA